LITFVSDKFGGYKIGFTHYFHRFAKLVFGVPIASKKYGMKHNIAIERHNEVKQRYKVTRGFKDPESGEAFTELRRIIYDFVRPHQGIGKTPAEAAGSNVVVNKRNKLLALINFFLSRLSHSPIFYILKFLMVSHKSPKFHYHTF